MTALGIRYATLPGDGCAALPAVLRYCERDPKPRADAERERSR